MGSPVLFGFARSMNLCRQAKSNWVFHQKQNQRKKPGNITSSLNASNWKRAAPLRQKLTLAMYRRYVITFKGNRANIPVTVAYGENQFLRSIDFGDQVIPIEAIEYCYGKIPSHEELLSTIGHLALIEAVPTDLSFNAFWEEYGNKQNKDRAFRFWTALPDNDRIAALRAIRRYNQYLAQKPGIEKKYPDTWLKNRCWNDEYKIK